MIAAKRLPAVIWLAAALATARGSDDDSGEATAAGKREAEQALTAELAAGGGGGIVQHEQDPPKQVICEREAGSRTGWRCTVTPSKGSETYVCLLELEPQTKTLTKNTCARVDN
jgi:hypothetical protein